MPTIQISLTSIFEVENSFLELFLRGSLLYLAILIMIRILPRRTGGELATMDLVFVLLVAEAAAHGFGDYKSVSEAIIVVGTLMAWNYVINVASYYIPFVEKLVSAPAIQIIRDGKLLRRNMRREYLTEEELKDYIRKDGIEDVGNVKSAFIESDGKISIVKN
jgi:uncharacterized membrane protein YcaP (DUF421 family)